MSKVLTIAATVIGVAALVLTGVGVIVGPAAMVGITAALGGVTAAMLGAAAGILSIGASLLAPRPKAPSLSQASIDRLNVTLDPRTNRKAVFGTTAFAADLRDHETNKAAGTVDNYWVDRFIVLAAHRVQSVDEIWFDDEKVWTSGGGVTGSASGFLTVDVRLEGNAANAINVSARLGSSRRFTGCAYVRFRYQISSKSPYISSIPTRITCRGKGMPVYDPRKDSTVTGGSGSQRADDQSTWQFDVSGNKQGDNPALQMLTWLLGWKIQNPVTSEWKLSVGRGLPKDRFDMASFIVAANACDEAVAKKGGGTERRYRAAGIVSEGEDPISVVDRFKAAMNATLDDIDGQIRVQVLVNDLGSPVASFTEKDIIGDFQWKPFENLTNSPNIVRGQYVDASDKSLYQIIDYPDVAIPSRDGIDRYDQISFDMVQSSSQAQRLAKQRLQRAQYPGFFQATFQCTAWKAQKGDVIELSFGPCGFLDKLFRVVEMEYREDGTVPVTLRDENAAIYAWDSTEEGDVDLADPLAFSILDDPWFQIITGRSVPPVFYSPDGNMFVDAQFGALWTLAGVLQARVDGNADVNFPIAADMPFVWEINLNALTDATATALQRVATTPGRYYWERIKVALATTASPTVGVTIQLLTQFYDSTDTVISGSDISLTIPMTGLPGDGSYASELLGGLAPVGAAYALMSIRVNRPGGIGYVRIAEPYLSDKQPGADVTATLGYGPTEIIINYNADGTLVAGQEDEFHYRLFQAGVFIAGNLAGMWRVVSGSVNAGIDPTDGAQGLTVSGDDLVLTLSSVEEDAVLSLEGSINGKTSQPLQVTAKRSVAAPSTGGGGGGGGGGGSNFNFTGPFTSPINSTTYMDIGGGLQSVVVASGQTKVDIAVNVNYKHDDTVPDPNTTNVSLKVQRETSPGSYTDVGAVVTKQANTVFIDDPIFAVRHQKAVFSFARQETLSPGTYKYRLVGAKGSGEYDVIVGAGTGFTFSGTPS